MVRYLPELYTSSNWKNSVIGTFEDLMRSVKSTRSIVFTECFQINWRKLLIYELPTGQAIYIAFDKEVNKCNFDDIMNSCSLNGSVSILALPSQIVVSTKYLYHNSFDHRQSAAAYMKTHSFQWNS